MIIKDFLEMESVSEGEEGIYIGVLKKKDRHELIMAVSLFFVPFENPTLLSQTIDSHLEVRL